MAPARILVTDDEALMREYVVEALERAGHRVEGVASGAEALARLGQHSYDLLVTDLKMVPMDGLALLQAAQQQTPDLPVVVMTAYGTIETAVAALKSGAADYLLKPVTPDALELAVSRVLEQRRLKRENQFLRQELRAVQGSGEMIGESRPMRELRAQIAKVADTRATVLIRGESGTGKELIARAIHYGSARRERPFIRVNCAALSAGILESELFGHERGAFTSAHERKLGRFELADKGTLLLDEISEIGVELQPKLLRALQEREFERVGGTDPIAVDVHLLATSNRDLEKAVQQGRFREDLFYRLNVITLQVPPLRERREDLPALLAHFVERFNRENGKHVRGVSDAARQRLMQYAWPGNVRELQNAVERAVILAEDDAPLGPEAFSLGGVQAPGGDAALRPGLTVGEMEQQLILKTLEHCQQNRTRAAELLGISVRTLRNKLREYREAGIVVGGNDDTDT